MLNKVCFVGWVIKDLNLLHPNQNNNLKAPKVNFQIRVNNPRSRKKPLYLECEAFDDQAQKLLHTVKKDTKIQIEGNLFIRKQKAHKQQLEKIIVGVVVAHFQVLTNKDN